MQIASTFTIVRSTETGSEPAGYVDRTQAIRAISDLLSAVELLGVKIEFPLDFACLQADLILQDWGHERFSFRKAGA